MTPETPSNTAPAANPPLPWRDWVLLPLIGVLTVCLLAGCAEWIAGRIFYRLPTSGENCLVLQDQEAGARGIPNCVIWEKIPEGKRTQYRFNSSGYRDNVEYGPKSPGTYRIVMVGTSVAAGFRQAQEKTIGGLLPRELSQRTGRKVEVYSEGLPWRTAHSVAHDLNDALASNPDMILWVVSPLDFSYASFIAALDAEEPRSAPAGEGHFARNWSLIKRVFARQSFLAAISTLFSHTFSATMLRDLFYRSPTQYVQASLAAADYKKEFLQARPSAEWDSELKEFESSAASIGEQATNAGVPLVAVLVPDRTQAAMISLMSERPKGFDPYKAGDEMRAIVVRHGGAYIDILPRFRDVPDPQLGYFALDGHPNAYGYALITGFIANQLADVVLSPRNTATRSQSGPQISRR